MTEQRFTFIFLLIISVVCDYSDVQRELFLAARLMLNTHLDALMNSLGHKWDCFVSPIILKRDPLRI